MIMVEHLEALVEVQELILQTVTEILHLQVLLKAIVEEQVQAQHQDMVQEVEAELQQ